VDLVEVISDYVALKPAGSRYKGLCPFHSEKTPSFTVDPQRGSWYCFGCNEGGDLFKFVQKIESISFVEAAERLGRRVGIEYRRGGESRESASERERLLRANLLAERFFRRELQKAPAVWQYLVKRGLAPETIEAFHLGFAPPGWTRLREFLQREGVSPEDAEKIGLLVRNDRGLRDRFVERVIFPIFDLEGRPIAFGGRALGDAQPKYLNSPETPTFIKGRTLYGLDRARTAISATGYAVAVEGYMDLIACHQAGFAQTIATLGTALTPEHVRILKRYATRLVLAYDGDAAGLRASLRAAPMFEEAGCDARVLRLPAGSDPDTFIAEQGRQAFQALIDAAEPLLTFHLERLREKYDLKEPAQRQAYVQEATREIGRSRSPLVRERYLGWLNETVRQLAGQWNLTDVSRAREEERAIRREIAQLQRGATSPRSGATNRVAAASEPMPAAPQTKMAAVEAYVLRAALTRREFWSEVTGRLQREQFAEPSLGSLVEFVFAQDLDGEDLAVVATRDPELAPLVLRLLEARNLPEVSLEGLAGAIARLERAGKKARLQALLREISERGLSQEDDPRTLEFRKLQSELAQDAKGDE
jgi:DNA primase catalytic core